MIFPLAIVSLALPLKLLFPACATTPRRFVSFLSLCLALGLVTRPSWATPLRQPRGLLQQRPELLLESAPETPLLSRSALLLALTQNDALQLEAYLKDGGDPNLRIRDKKSRTAKSLLQWTIALGHLEVFQTLLQHANRKLNGQGALVLAIQSQNPDFLRCLLALGLAPTLKDLKHAIELQKPQVFKQLAAAATASRPLTEAQMRSLDQTFLTHLFRTPLVWPAWFAAAPEWTLRLLHLSLFWESLYNHPAWSQMNTLIESSLMLWINQLDLTAARPAHLQELHQRTRGLKKLEEALGGQRILIRDVLGQARFTRILLALQQGKNSTQRRALHYSYQQVLRASGVSAGCEDAPPLRAQTRLAGLEAHETAEGEGEGTEDDIPATTCCPVCFEDAALLRYAPQCDPSCWLCLECLKRQLSLPSQTFRDSCCFFCKAPVNPEALLKELQQNQLSQRDQQWVEQALVVRLKKLQQACNQIPCGDTACLGLISNHPPQQCEACQERLAQCPGCLLVHPLDIFCHSWALTTAQSQKSHQKLLEQARSPQALIRPCPHCDTLTERSGGCNSMECARCGRAWHWNYGKTHQLPRGVSLHDSESLPMQYFQVTDPHQSAAQETVRL